MPQIQGNANQIETHWVSSIDMTNAVIEHKREVTAACGKVIQLRYRDNYPTCELCKQAKKRE